MNEEKIIDYLKEIIQEIEYRHKDGELILVNDTTTDKLYYSIKGLLDLYNKEIQRNKDLEEIEKEHKEENGRLRNRIKELEMEKEKNNKIYDFCRRELAFERRLKKEKRKPDEFNQGRFYVCENIKAIITNKVEESEK